VASIFYEFRILEDIDQREYESNLLDNDENDSWQANDEVTRIRIARGWLAYKALLDEQQYMKKNYQDMSILSQCLTRFPILKSLEMSSDYEPPTEELERMLVDTYAVQGNMLDGGDVTEEDEVGVRAMTTLLSAASGMQKKLDSLSAHRVHWSFFSSSPKGMSFYRPAFAYLRNLNMSLEADYDDTDEEDIVEARHNEFGIALRGATGLETLSLTFGDSDIPPESIYTQRQMQIPVVWDKLVKNVCWTNLRFLELHVVTVSERYILEFLERHTSLKRLKWHSMWLTNSDVGWDKIFRGMRTMKFEALQFGGIWGGEGDKGRNKTLKMDEIGAKIVKSILTNDTKKGKKVHVRRGKRSLSDGQLFHKAVAEGI
jgi:hypothetical protein